MTTISRETLIDAAYAADIEEDGAEGFAYIYLDYSGRGMYGRECVGIVGDAGDAIRFAAALAEETGQSISELGLDRASTDSMGRRMITYWTGLQAGEEDA